MACCPEGLQTNVRHRIFHTIPSPERTTSAKLRRELCWKKRNTLTLPLVTSDHEYIPAYTIVGGISLQDRGRRVLEEVQLLAVRDHLLTKLECRYSIRSPY